MAQVRITGKYELLSNGVNADNVEVHMENIKHILEKFKEETAIPSIVLTTERKDNMALTDSKLGGLPYLPKDYAYPATAKGEPLKLLAQLNFAQLPKLDNFPATGILQFYVLPDDSVGLQEWPTLKQDTFRVIYHKEILPSEALMSDFPEIQVSTDGHGYEWFPFQGEFFLKGSTASCPMTVSTYEFEDAFLGFCRRNNIESYFETYFTDIQELRKDMTKSEFKEFSKKQRMLQNLVWDTFEDEEVHRISGYPFFTQRDQRDYYDSLKRYDVLLFQITSEYNTEKEDYEIMWGDCGVANFFINLEDLKNLDFEDVIYAWDCC